jgi:hypothetical protein
MVDPSSFKINSNHIFCDIQSVSWTKPFVMLTGTQINFQNYFPGIVIQYNPINHVVLLCVSTDIVLKDPI